MVKYYCDVCGKETSHENIVKQNTSVNKNTIIHLQVFAGLGLDKLGNADICPKCIFKALRLLCSENEWIELTPEMSEKDKPVEGTEYLVCDMLGDIQSSLYYSNGWADLILHELLDPQPTYYMPYPPKPKQKEVSSAN